MKGKSYILKTNGTVTPIEPKNGTDFQLDELREAIGGGWIEVVRLSGRQIMVIDEEGKLKKLPVNLQASRLYNGAGNADIIAGDALVCDRRQVR